MMDRRDRVVVFSRRGRGRGGGQVSRRVGTNKLLCLLILVLRMKYVCAQAPIALVVEFKVRRCKSW